MVCTLPDNLRISSRDPRSIGPWYSRVSIGIPKNAANKVGILLDLGTQVAEVTSSAATHPTPGRDRLQKQKAGGADGDARDPANPEKGKSGDSHHHDQRNLHHPVDPEARTRMGRLRGDRLNLPWAA
jgi:hypothetical protein